MLTARPRSLAIAVCCALAGNASAAPLAPLRVDPALLGLTPIPVAPPAAVDPAVVTRPVTAPIVEGAPLLPAEPPAAPVAKDMAPAEAPPQMVSPSRPEAPPAGPALRAPLAASPRREAATPPVTALVADAPQPVQSSQSSQRTEPLPPQIFPALEWDEAEREDALPPLKLRASTRIDPPAKSDDLHPTFIRAERMSGINDIESVAEGDVELRKRGSVITADHLTYRPLDDEAELTGNVRMVGEKSTISGPHLKIQVEDQVGFFEKPEYTIRHEVEPGPGNRQTTEARGSASLIEFHGVNQYQLKDAVYSTCQPGDDSWFARISDLHLDYDREVGEGRNGAVYFKGVPIIYSPWLTFSLNNQRKSGFLAPTFGSTSHSGGELTLPYYWNIAPNRDATIAPRLFSKRGVQLSTEFRYLETDYSGTARVEALPGDQVRNRDRWGYAISHSQTLPYGFSGSLNLNGVSDDFYYRDLSTRLANSAQSLLVRQGTLSYAGSWWSASALVQKYQTLQTDPANPVGMPYEYEPQLTLSGRRTLFGLADLDLLGQHTAFRNPDQARLRADRSVLYPQVSLPWITPAFYVTPKLGVHLSRYSFDNAAAGIPSTYSRSVPIASVDSGVTFERKFDLLGRDFVQTLEPRLFYVYIPFRDQRVLINNGINFDSGIGDFNFAQIFSENPFTGHDRIGDANQATMAVTSRLLDPQTGGELLKAMVGQRLYFKNQQVTVNAADLPRTTKKTDLLAALTGQVLPYTYADWAWQYNPRDRRTERFNVAARYQPQVGHALAAAYRVARNQAAPFEVNLKQIDVTGQWPLFGGWNAVGRYNYSLNEHRVIETIAGLEYDSGCWSARMVMQRFSTTATTQTTALFLQLELTDFSRIGSNPLELLKRSIPGYGQVQQPSADPVFGIQ